MQMMQMKGKNMREIKIPLLKKQNNKYKFVSGESGWFIRHCIWYWQLCAHLILTLGNSSCDDDPDGIIWKDEMNPRPMLTVLLSIDYPVLYTCTPVHYNHLHKKIYIKKRNIHPLPGGDWDEPGILIAFLTQTQA